MEVPFVFANSDEIPNNKFLVDYSRKAGIVYQNRTRGLGFQYDFINIQLIKETISDNKAISMHLNSSKLHQNKVSLASQPEVSIKYLLEAYKQLDLLQNNMFIVPIIITYDRVFELSKIAKEMLTAQKKDISIRDIISHVLSS